MSAENIRNTYRRQGAQAERERIIKLLEAHPCFSLETCQQGCLAHELLVAHIALIKGENK